MQLSSQLEARLAAVAGQDALVKDSSGLHVYECDGYTLEKARPGLVVLPGSVEALQAVVRVLTSARIPFVPRGAGTGVSGGCLPAGIPVMIGTSRLKRIRHIDVQRRVAEVEAGVVNIEVTRAVAPHGLYYAPDPSSQNACTIGGNVAENSGGPHTLKYGVTTNHVLSIEWVLPDGELLRLDRRPGRPGYDLGGLVVGSEGTLGIATAVEVRLLPEPQGVATLLAVFSGVLEATRAVSRIVAAGIVPAALEMMDALVIRAVEEAYGFGFPTDAGAVLIIELDGASAGLEAGCRQVAAACREEGATNVRRARDEAERALLWKSRKRAFGAMGRLAPNYCTQDGVVPRSRLPEIAERIAEIGARHRLRIANLMHAGDGNIHPLLLYDERDEEEVARVLEASREILEACVDLGGSVTGEHGIGVEKVELMPRVFGPDAIASMLELRSIFNPAGLCNPHKVFPQRRGCVEVTRPRPRGGG